MGNTALPRFGDPNLDRLSNLIEDALNDIEGKPLAGVIVLPRQLVGATDTRIYHGLGHVVSGYWIVGSPADARVFDGLTPESIDPAHYFTLRASTANVVALAVF